MGDESVMVELRGRVGWITINRPKALNALNAEVIDKIDNALQKFSVDPAVGCIVLAGSEKAFAAGADLKEVQGHVFPDTYLENFLASWDCIARFRKPMVAAVAGYALGGGCEIAMMCDLIIAADDAKFGLPEVKVGTMPGAGGTQRLARSIGKAKAMDLCLTGRTMGAEEAERAGLVARVVPCANLLSEASAAAEAIAQKSLPIAMGIKESVNCSFETSLSEGLRFERRVFQSICGLKDQQEGVAAFIEKRPAKIVHR